MDLNAHDLAVAGALGELKATVEATQRSISDLRDLLSDKVKPLESRVTALESWRYLIIGGAAALAYVAQYIPKIGVM
ncbi:MAG: hypothetical protein ACT4QA_16470 [Panacagrimonas sp.]